ncbi:glutamate racemase [Oceanihabitans sediminis]|uniref:Glutamate racemase n=1 Tax=Oceanihabitans sediminis TaxID=1812012 RepID=A0A368P7Y7_9FLAO|nr:glutamate racemase [Oceanihabitans sediminis]RBP34343.1 glutamate racemase [Oceanihabitans sediminis]RCU58025.1 glutamate racemase [Oceanihabitans sediminis]
MSKQAIGMFDSGVGGTSIWKELNALLPHENTIYLADSKNAPYGNKSNKEILSLSEKNVEFLIKKKCKLIVVACNTATTNAIHKLREKYNIPFIGIEPAIKPAALQTKTKAIGILATKGTLSSDLFHKKTNLFTNDIKVIEQVGEGIVDLIENGKVASDEMKELLKIYMHPMLKANIDYLVLGCTHYPYLIPQLLEILPSHIKIIDSGEAVARQTKAVLRQHNLLNNVTNKPTLKFYSNGKPEVMQQLLTNDYPVEYLDF